MSVVARVHFDGKTVVLEEPVDLPINQSIEAEFRIPEPKLAPDEIARRRAALKRLASRAIHGLNIPDEALRRENMYEPPRGL